ncbi:MAG TPA: cytochrome b N-terminal domain-containing protein [Polyangiaceae bacterium]|jgi:ubiquinol-cytochrome c reductase cytochrome b subunit|nr:cytochrome b N-terminal domain-containing protein [Polyangiaceae bacterium]
MSALKTAADWLDERTDWRSWSKSYLDHPLVGGGPLASAIAASVATCFGVLALTGVLLMTAYAPSPQTAWASVHYVEFVQAGGWLIRGLHYWAAQMFFVLAGLHVVQAALAGTYRKPGEVGWWLTLLVLGMAVGEGITGGLLPWDQLGWWARVVEGNIAGLAPVIGGFVSQMIAGGTELGALGLTRAFTEHVILLPPILALAIWGRRRLAGRAPDAGREGARVARNALVAVLVLFALFALVGARHGAPLEAPADPLSDYPARPEWFLMPMYQLRKFFHGAMEFWGTSLVPGAAVGYLVVLPWIDKPGRSRVATVFAPVIFIFAGAGVLSAMARSHDMHDSHYVKARAKSDREADAAIKLAMNGVPPAGALAMVRADPEIHGRALFDAHCASCHVLGDLGDPEKATATRLDGWGTPEWIEAMIHDPDGPLFFGKGPYKEQMPSVDQRPANKPAGEAWTAMVKTDAEKTSIALFLASLGDEPGDPARPALDAKTRAAAEKIVSERCTSCHLYKGQGDDEGSGIAPELAGYGSIAWTKAQVANPANVATYREKALDADMKKHMPRFDTDLSAADVEIVARWTREHARATPFAH